MKKLLKEFQKIKRIQITALTIVSGSALFFLFPMLFNFSGFSGKTLAAINSPGSGLKKPSFEILPQKEMWQAPAVESIPNSPDGKMILYGRDLIANTAKYLGPNGSVRHISNGMNCQNCHLDAGTKIMGNNYAAVYSTYPKFRARSASKETIIKRISDCFERSLNGTKPDSSSKEMQAMVAYMKWLGTGTEKGEIPEGTGLEKLPYLNRAANPETGKMIYKAKCESCHGVNGQGIPNPDKITFIYPPLWGKSSYNDGAGLFRISSFAGYVKNNMPFGANYENKILTDEEAWDLAAFVNSQPRPHKDQKNDWRDIAKKPVDFPFAPYADKFSEKQHKLGPFQNIVLAQKQNSK
ncbi:c-type cytochrome [Dyadobacter sp. 3J3]|uniref:c-type cytochrome n=1 Tax=Dyadobacter sp. 3J3 TaxID=2606600 RepID=UPI00286DB10D|nr:c-type cytochrome [Dyadobacter sp. 3J3]